jgi:phosphoribosylpyrophosphate synthetase
MIHWLKTNYKVEDLIIVSPDAGGAKRSVLTHHRQALLATAC